MAIHRRTFLKSLIALGASVALPADATQAQVDAAWQRLQAKPYFFDVNEYGTIDEDLEDPAITGRSRQARAMAFFNVTAAGVAQELGVEIVEGEHPGSSYFAAELRNDIDDANATAEQLGLPFRFRAAGR